MSYYVLKDQSRQIFFLSINSGMSSNELYASQQYMDRFIQNPLSIDVTPTNYGIFDSEGVTYNWNSRMLAVCGGKQV